MKVIYISIFYTWGTSYYEWATKVTPSLSGTHKLTPSLSGTHKLTPTLSGTCKPSPTLSGTRKLAPTLSGAHKLTPFLTVKYFNKNQQKPFAHQKDKY